MYFLCSTTTDTSTNSDTTLSCVDTLSCSDNDSGILHIIHARYCRTEKFGGHFNLVDWRFARRQSKLMLANLCACRYKMYCVTFIRQKKFHQIKKYAILGLKPQTFPPPKFPSLRYIVMYTFFRLGKFFRNRSY